MSLRGRDCKDSPPRTKELAGYHFLPPPPSINIRPTVEISTLPTLPNLLAYTKPCPPSISMNPPFLVTLASIPALLAPPTENLHKPANTMSMTNAFCKASILEVVAGLISQADQ